jgi:hypothetical protein
MAKIFSSIFLFELSRKTMINTISVTRTIFGVKWWLRMRAITGILEEIALRITKRMQISGGRQII